MSESELPVPPHFDPERVADVWRVDYGAVASAARAWAQRHDLPPAHRDRTRICLVAVDVQNTFCIPGFELFVGGRSGQGAVDDNRRLCRWIYCNLGHLTRIVPTLDTHQAMQIFHPLFLVDAYGEHPEPYTQITVEDVETGRWRFNEAIAQNLGITPAHGRKHLEHYVRTLRSKGKYDLTVWPYHAMLGGIGHALVSSVEEATFFHSVARYAQPNLHIKGSHPLTEHYSALNPEVAADHAGQPLDRLDATLMAELLDYDAVVIAGQAKSHCVAWTIDDLLSDLLKRDRKLVEKVYLLEDCTSPVVIPGGPDYTEQADAAFQRFADAGMHVVRSTDPIATWPGMRKRLR